MNNNDKNHTLVPTVAIDTPRGLRTMDLYSLLLKERTILFAESFTFQSCEKLVSSILYLDSISSDPINIYINSPGGAVYACLTVLEAIQNCKCLIKTYLMGGMAASCGAMLFIAGDERYMSPFSTLMFHQVSGQNRGTVADMKINFAQSKWLQDIMFNIIISRSNDTVKTLKDVEKICDRDNYMDVTTAMSYGFVDKLLDAKMSRKTRTWGTQVYKAMGFISE